MYEEQLQAGASNAFQQLLRFMDGPNPPKASPAVAAKVNIFGKIEIVVAHDYWPQQDFLQALDQVNEVERRLTQETHDLIGGVLAFHVVTRLDSETPIWRRPMDGEFEEGENEAFMVVAAYRPTHTIEASMIPFTRRPNGSIVLGVPQNYADVEIPPGYPGYTFTHQLTERGS